MTPEQRLDRLERIAKLFVKAGVRERRNIREQREKINMLIDTQIRTEERFAKTEQAIERLIGAQAQTDLKLQALIDAIRQKGLGESLA